MSSDIIDGNAGTNDLAEISFHAFLVNITGTTMKLQGTLNGCKDFYPFSVGGADLVLGIKWLASLNTVQANWNEMFLIFNLNGKRCKLQGVPQESNAPVAFQYFSKEADTSELFGLSTRQIPSPSTYWTLQPLPVPERIWEDVSLDFIVGLPKSGGFDTILVVVDHLSKYSHFIPLSHPYTAKIVAKIFCKEIVRLHGIPRSILSNRDVIFLSAFWQELFRLSQTRLRMVGDSAFLRVQPYRQRSLAHRRASCFLQNTSDFHVSLLRPAHGQQAVIPPALLPLNEDWELTISPAKILAHQWVKEAGSSSLELLIHWVDRPLEEASWENYDLIADQFPSFLLEDKATFQGGYTDTNAPLRTYSRRKYRRAACGDNLS
ncbi:hypothetical protein KY290_027032 [Solanum tuberosum]|uniref:Integrase catalytic domain-containing protein n=1 Tax=Solanum tuberosum TaxID=4113 RepID=A0ABQ7UDW0_SOLTU|nr:hypothetical protein KY290_027032 [Solanum tuberosum]